MYAKHGKPVKSASKYQINMKDEQEPTTVSYNTKVFNREIMALRKEEEALLRYQNATRKREFKIDTMKHVPGMIDYESLSSSAQKK